MPKVGVTGLLAFTPDKRLWAWDLRPPAPSIFESGYFYSGRLSGLSCSRPFLLLLPVHECTHTWSGRSLEQRLGHWNRPL